MTALSLIFWQIVSSCEKFFLPLQRLIDIIMTQTLKLLTIGAAAALLTACGGRTFNVKGQITGAADSVLHFENVGLAGISEVATATLDADGSFDFSGEAPEAPEFYRLRISDQIINIAIDSTETIEVKAPYPNMATDYEVSGSDNNQKIRELALKQILLQQKAADLERNRALPPNVIRDSLFNMIRAYKEDVKANYIFREPYKAYAYFALFQTLGPWLIFDPKSNDDDIKVFAAVATSWDTYFPHAERGENLHNIAIEGMRNKRIIDSRRQETIEPEKIVESGVIDIELTDNQGRTRRLTELKGKVVLLDFHLFAMDDSPKRILSLRELYNKYHSQGLEIFQVSLDGDEHFWKQQTAALPWVSVRDADGTGSTCLRQYNVQQLPEFFIIDRGNNLVKRSEQMDDVDSEIRRLL